MAIAFVWMLSHEIRDKTDTHTPTIDNRRNQKSTCVDEGKSKTER